MSGHSKWATIKHKKGAQDAARGKLFAKLIRQVEVAAREGGGDIEMNPTLRTMYQKARSSSVPLDTIEKAIKRGTGARGLRAILEEILLNTMYDMPSRSDVGRVVVDAEAVRNKTNPTLIPLPDVLRERSA